jgi:uncharacterized damage-inducible protein DinB
MPVHLPWTQRTFNFDFPVEIYPDILERLRGLSPRIEAKVRAIPPNILTRREREGTWSIQENIGHLVDLEPLGFTRLKEYMNGVETLSAADMTNARTHEAAHNDRPIDDLLNELAQDRRRFLAQLDCLDPTDFARTAFHPRLKTIMRMVDWLSFVAAHDDYHLARMTELMALFSVQRV